MRTRYFIELAYDGTAYHGWQVQANAHTVQAELHAAMRTVLRQPVETIGSGRTDTGVHAWQQFAHFDVPAPLDNLSQVVLRLNALLPSDIAVKNIFPVPDGVHARFDAESRCYEYRITSVRNPFLTNRCHFYPKPLRVDWMNEAARVLRHHEDFECFSRVKTEVNHFRCRITEVHWEVKADCWPPDLLVFRIRADRFLRGMVRAIVGTLLPVGLGQATAADVERIVLSKDRRQAGPAVPPQGLFLTEVRYPAGVVTNGAG
ncbi:MAG: tRNA pseudouridine(38-40) synthase TruA [Ferruginibacter sp.]|nr:tRNA pseudouridine(38-40) synthase TruA [Cytophagales bacterium]